MIERHLPWPAPDFDRLVRDTPDAVALHDGEFALTYRELATVRDQLAVELGRSRVPRGALVGLRLGRGWLSVVGILGVRKHGCGYLALNPRHPAERQRRLLRRAGVRHLLTEAPDGLALEHLPAPPADR